MNRKEWIEYFEAINNRKPTIQECQQALLNGEFVMEGKQATFSNSGKSVTEGVRPLPNQMTGQMVNPAYSQQMVFVKKKKFGKKTFIGLGIALFLVVATSLGLFWFSSKGTKLVTKRNVVALFLAFAISATGYYIAEGIMFGFTASFFTSVSGSIVQSGGSAIMFVIIGTALDKIGFKTNIAK